MVADGRLGDVEVFGNFDGGHVAVGEQFKDSAPCGIGQGFEGIVQGVGLLSSVR